MQHPSIDVVITNVEIKQFESGNQYKITGDTNRGQMKFKFYQTKTDGTEGSAYQQWRSMGLKIGSTVNIAYSEEQKEYQGKPYTDRRVIWFRESNGSGVGISSQSVEKPRGEANRGQSEGLSGSTPSRNWDREAFEKCSSIWAAAELQKEGYTIDAAIANLPHYYRLFQAIRQSGYEKFEAKTGVAGGKPVSSSAKEAFDRGMARAQELPTIQQDDDINVEDIPF
jgi:hypothetical protein